MKAERDAVMAPAIPLMAYEARPHQLQRYPKQNYQEEVDQKPERTLPEARQGQAVKFICPCRLMSMIVPFGHRLLV